VTVVTAVVFSGTSTVAVAPAPFEVIAGAWFIEGIFVLLGRRGLNRVRQSCGCIARAITSIGGVTSASGAAILGLARQKIRTEANSARDRAGYCARSGRIIASTVSLLAQTILTRSAPVIS